MEGLKAIPFLALILAISGVVIGAGAIVISKFGDTVTHCQTASHTYNATKDYCCGASGAWAYCTGANNSNVTTEYRVILDSIESQGSIGEQLPVVGIIAVMTIIIAIIAGVFVYLKLFN